MLVSDVAWSVLKELHEKKEYSWMGWAMVVRRRHFARRRKRRWHTPRVCPYSRGLYVIRTYGRRRNSLPPFLCHIRARALPHSLSFRWKRIRRRRCRDGRCSARAIRDSSASRKSDLVVGRTTTRQCERERRFIYARLPPNTTICA